MSNRVTLKDLRRAMSAAPQDDAAASALGMALAERSEYEEAASMLARATELAPAHAPYWFRLAAVLAARQQWDRAIHSLRTGLTRMSSPHRVARLGRFYESSGDPAAALRTYLTAVQSSAGVRGCTELCKLLLRDHSAGEARARLAELAPDLAEAPSIQIGLARALQEHGRYYEALQCWTNASGLAADDPTIIVGAAEAHTALRNFATAERLLEDGCGQHPKSGELLMAYLEFLYRQGRIEAFQEGIRASGFIRSLGKPRLRQPDAAPVWDGTQDVAGRTILIEYARGYGDVLHYVRFASLLKERGATVILEVPEKIRQLMETFPGADGAVAPFEACGPYDFQCGPFDPAYFLGWSWRWMSDGVPYVRADPARRRAWARRFDRRHLHVGLVWRSNAVDAANPYTFRSAPLAAFEPLGRLDGVVLHGVQVGGGMADLRGESNGWLADNVGDEITDFSDSAAAMESLDVIVTIDSGPAHLAGALGRPSFILLPYHPCMRWMPAAPAFEEHGCPWYPSARLFTQERPGDWASAVVGVADELRVLATPFVERDSYSVIPASGHGPQGVA